MFAMSLTSAWSFKSTLGMIKDNWCTFLHTKKWFFTFWLWWKPVLFAFSKNTHTKRNGFRWVLLIIQISFSSVGKQTLLFQWNANFIHVLGEFIKITTVDPIFEKVEFSYLAVFKRKSQDLDRFWWACFRIFFSKKKRLAILIIISTLLLGCFGGRFREWVGFCRAPWKSPMN